jgi:hypothetical protein
MNLAQKLLLPDASSQKNDCAEKWQLCATYQMFGDTDER